MFIIIGLLSAPSGSRGSAAPARPIHRISGGQLDGACEFLLRLLDETALIAPANVGADRNGAIDEGRFEGGKWIPDRRLNGHESGGIRLTLRGPDVVMKIGL
jgi:hypothetical protein